MYIFLFLIIPVTAYTMNQNFLNITDTSCGGYDPNNDICCAGILTNCYPNCNSFKCFFSVAYDSTQQICCGEMISNCFFDCNIEKCCLSVPYDPTQYICCDYELTYCYPNCGEFICG